MHDLEEWLQLPDIYSRAVMSDTHGRQTPPPEMDERRVRPAMRGREVRPIDLPRGRGKMPQATFVPRSRGMLPIHHEQSETVQLPDGRWVNVYGRELPNARQQLPGTPVYDTVEEAVLEATRRSAQARGMLDRIDGRIPRPGPVRPKTPTNGGVRG